jgi:hypothetical protein
MMMVCAMWYNGFLQILEIKPEDGRPLDSIRRSLTRRFRRLNILRAPAVTRISARPSGQWTIETEYGDRCNADLISGWIMGYGWCIGLYWKSDSGKRFRCWVAGSGHDAILIRRMIVRLKLPVSTPPI